MSLALHFIQKEKKERTGSLDLGNCGLTEVPDLSELPWLHTLILSNSWYNREKEEWVSSQNNGGKNKLAAFPSVLPLPQLRKLVIAGARNDNWSISDLKPLGKLENLTQLDFSSNKVSDLKPLKKLENLTHLDFRYNLVSDLKPLKNLENLMLLSFGSNLVSDLKPLEGLIKLKELSFWINRVSDLMPLARLENLMQLDFKHNQVSDLRPLKWLENLTHLNFGHNEVSDLEPLERLKKLTQLIFSENEVTDLKHLLPLIEKGIIVKWKDFVRYGIAVEDNPLETPPPEIVQQGNQAILNYFRERELGGKEKSLEAKVVLIGEGQAGKTSLRTRLLRPGEALPTKADRTKGLDIEIEQYSYSLAGGERMRLNLFDFGGQDHYKPLHQFFYSKNTLYVLVTRNGDAATNDFDFWFDTAQLFGQGSPVLVVNNLFGDVRSQFDASKFARFATLIRGTQDVNLNDFDDRRWDEVKSSLEHLASRLPHVHKEIPKAWANVRLALTDRRPEQVLPLLEYLRICALPENGGMDRKRALHCSDYLHDIGVILHYQDTDDLRPWVIVKNEWATEAAYRVIDDPIIADRNGLFTHDDLQRIWCQPEYEDHRPQLRELMRKFRLCYPLKGDIEFIAPQLLPARPPDGYDWQADLDLELYVEYEFMPPGLFSQLIVEAHLLIAEERRLVWRDGVVLELSDGQARAEIRLQKRSGKQTIGIKAQGAKCRDLLTIANGKIEELHQYFGKGLRVERRIPCVCDRCTTSEDKWFFNLSELENRLEAGITTKDCEKSYKPVSIQQLLGNVFSKNVRAKDYEEASSVEAPLAFFSYSKSDIEHLKEFRKHLRTLERNGKIRLWDDRNIRPGEEWDDEIRQAMAKSDIIFLLVSVDFLNTDYIWNIELAEAMRRHEAKEAKVIPIKLRDCSWADTPFIKLQGIPRKDKVISTASDRDSIWVEVVKEIEREIAGR